MTTINVDIGKLKAIRRTISSKRDEMKTLLSEMDKTEDGISAIWTAASQVDFSIKFETWKFQVETDFSALDNVVAGLGSAIEEAERMDRQFGT